jgi:hypothetical protein
MRQITLGLVIPVSWVLAVNPAQGQSLVPNLAAGFEVSGFRLDTSYTRPEGPDFSNPGVQRTEWGAGGWLTYAINDHVMLDGAVDAFSGSDAPGGGQIQAVAGLKSGVRRPTFGVFGKARPGIVRYARRFHRPDSACPLCLPSPSHLVHRTNAVMDVGAVVELYPPGRTVLRADIGRTLVRLGSPNGGFSTDGMRLSVGGGVRF